MIRQAGVTLIEVLIAVSLLSLLSVGILFALRVGLSAMGKANARLMDNRRVSGTQRILEQQIAGFIPVMALCGASAGNRGIMVPFLHAEAESMRLVSNYSLQYAGRGLPQILELRVMPTEDGRGVRLVVNELLYNGPAGAGSLCLGLAPDPTSGFAVPQFRPIETSPTSFVLADKLAYCRFSYLGPAPPPAFDAWRPNWIFKRWPIAIRVEMASLEADPSRLHPVTITVPLHVDRDPVFKYEDTL
jgi:prepilin-type N-terminal cleavage/methylation domain-containing protein